MTRRRRPSSPSPGPAHPLEDDDLLHEILLRLPPQPPYLMRASLVSKRWGRLVTDPKFLRRFRLHHRKPPLLGIFSCSRSYVSFRSTLDPPYCIPPERFSPRLQVHDHEDWSCLDCRHGRMLFDNWSRHHVVVWNPITDDYRVVADTPRFHGPGTVVFHRGAVLCADGDQGHTHGACHSSPFKVAVLGMYAHHEDDEAIVFASVYSSETDTWCDLVSTTLPHGDIYISESSTLVGNTLHWLNFNGILEFDLDTQKLAVLKRPLRVDYSAVIILAEDGGLGFAALSCGPNHYPVQLYLQIWERKVDSYGVATWVLRKTVELQKILGLGFKIDRALTSIMHYDEDANAIFWWMHSSVFMVQLGSMQSRELFRDDLCTTVRPFTSFYTEGICSSLKQKNLISG